jgi:serine/threonine protein kinase
MKSSSFRDLKSLNVLLDGKRNAKLADFGLAIMKEETMTRTKVVDGGQGTFQWMGNLRRSSNIYIYICIILYLFDFLSIPAPELFEPDTPASKASDIYAYGIVCWEILAMKSPWRGQPISLVAMWITQQRKHKPVFGANLALIYRFPPTSYKCLKEKRPTIPSTCPPVYSALIEKCWAQDPESRFACNQILECLSIGIFNYC